MIPNREALAGRQASRGSSRFTGKTDFITTGEMKGEKGSDMSAWFSLFSDLDPLANPDAIDKQNKKKEEDRQC